jgi:hypothetical protein
MSRFDWISLNHFGALATIALTWSAMTGTSAVKKSTTAATTRTTTVKTARPRRTPCRPIHSTEGLRPTAKNSDTAISTRIDPMSSSSPANQNARSAPAAPNSPSVNGVRWFSGG